MRAKRDFFHVGRFGLVGVPAGVGTPSFLPVHASVPGVPVSAVIEARGEGNEGVLFLSGVIADASDDEGKFISSEEILAKFQELEAKYDTITIHMRNLYGGVVSNGFNVYNAIKESSKTVETLAEGIVASFGSILFAAGAERRVVRYSKLMVHEGQGGVRGTVGDIREYADTMDAWNNDMVNAYSECLGWDEDKVRSEWFNGKDHWLTPEKAQTLGLATEVVKGAVKKAAAVTKLKSPSAVMAFYQEQFQNDNQSNEEMKNKAAFLAVLASVNPDLKIDADASEEAILAEFKSQAKELTDVRAELKTMREKVDAAEAAKVTALVDGAVEAGKITAKQKEQFETLAKADYENTKAIIDEMKGHESITARLGGENGGKGLPFAADFEHSTYKEIVSAGAKGTKYLTALEKQDKDAFDKLKAAYDELPQ